MADSTQYILKILSGPHQGAEVALSEGKLLIGSNLECDLILSDSLIAPNHLSLQIGSSEIAITPLADPVYLDGQRIPHELKLINPYQFITLGTTHLAIGPAHTAWPSLPLPALGNKPSSTPPPEAPALDESEANVATPQPAFLAPPTYTTQPTKPLAAKQLVLPVAIGVASLCVMLAMAYVFMSAPARGSFTAIDASMVPGLQAQVQSLAADQGLSNDALTLSYTNNKLIVTGLTATNEQRRSLEHAIRALSPYIQASIRSQENVATTCKELLTLLGADVTVTTIKPGVVKISGYLPNDSTWTKAKKSLLSDTPGLTEIIDDVQTPLRIQNKVTPILTKYQIDQQIQIRARSDGVYAEGNLSEGSQTLWYDAKAQIEQALGPSISLGDKVVLISGGERIYLDAKIESITITDNLKWIALRNDKTYFEGSMVPSGYVVDAISRQGVTLKRGSERVVLKVGDQ